MQVAVGHLQGHRHAVQLFVGREGDLDVPSRIPRAGARLLIPILCHLLIGLSDKVRQNLCLAHAFMAPGGALDASDQGPSENVR